EGGNHPKYGSTRRKTGRADAPYRCIRGETKFNETIERINRPRKSSRVRRRASKRSSQEPMSLSIVPLSNINAGTISNIAGSTPALANKGMGAGVKCKTESNHQDAAENACKNQSDQIETTILLAQAVAQYSPAKSRNQLDLLEDADGWGHISHESSSSCGRSAPSWPTIERKICSSVVLSPASPDIPARNSSSEPCATSRPS